MRKDQTVELQGKTHPLYSGVLEEAHERGLQGISVDLVQVPTEENGFTAICRAVVTMKDGSTFSDYGDANARNTNSRIATALIRMASTRAKGRALRDAVNIGEALREEMPDDEEDAPRAAPRPVTHREIPPPATLHVDPNFAARTAALGEHFPTLADARDEAKRLLTFMPAADDAERGRMIASAIGRVHSKERPYTHEEWLGAVLVLRAELDRQSKEEKSRRLIEDEAEQPAVVPTANAYQQGL